MTKILTVLSILLLIMTNCSNHIKQQVPQLSLESCYRENLKDSTLMTGWYYIVSDSGFVRQKEKSDEQYFIYPCPIVTAEDFVGLEIHEEQSEYTILYMKFGKRGTQAWATATGNATGKHLAFIVKNKLLYVPSVQNKITAGISAFGRTDYSKAEVEEIKQSLEIETQSLKNKRE